MVNRARGSFVLTTVTSRTWLPATRSRANVCAMGGAHSGAIPAQRVSSGFDEGAGGDEETGRRASCMPPEVSLSVSPSKWLRGFLGWENISQRTSLTLHQSFKIVQILLHSLRQSWGIKNRTYF